MRVGLLTQDPLDLLQLCMQGISLLDDFVEIMHQFPILFHPVLQVRLQILDELCILVATLIRYDIFVLHVEVLRWLWLPILLFAWKKCLVRNQVR